MRRQSTRTPAIVSIRADRTDREINVNERSGVIQEFASLIVSEDPCKAPDRELQRRADIRFAIGIALTIDSAGINQHGRLHYNGRPSKGGLSARAPGHARSNFFGDLHFFRCFGPGLRMPAPANSRLSIHYLSRGSD